MEDKMCNDILNSIIDTASPEEMDVSIEKINNHIKNHFYDTHVHEERISTFDSSFCPHCHSSTIVTLLSNTIETIIKDQGVTLYTNTKIVEYIKEKDTIVDIKVITNNQEKIVPSQIVLNCAGILPNTEFITTVEKAVNGAIKVNTQMETSIKDIYDAGDCSIMKSAVSNTYMYAPLGTNANKHGRIIADALSNNEPKPFMLL